ncbi:hypothetical protein [Pseudoduganella sp.]|uniref:hypothetical protein n=1 Tax=Pseudoduganella sp. TaxID=1880898 RepID=UPI0035B07531
MSNAAEEMTQCINALTELVSALHRLMDNYPELREYLLPATLRLSETIPCVSFFLSMDMGEVERRLSALETDVAQLMIDVAQLKIDVAQLKIDVAQLKIDVAQLKIDIAQLKAEMVEVKVAIARIEGRLDTFATKDDLHKQTWRIYGAMTVLVAGVYFIARYVH